MKCLQDRLKICGRFGDCKEKSGSIKETEKTNGKGETVFYKQDAASPFRCNGSEKSGKRTTLYMEQRMHSLLRKPTAYAISEIFLFGSFSNSMAF